MQKDAKATPLMAAGEVGVMLSGNEVMLDDINDNASLVVNKFQELTDFEFGYNEKSIEWIDRFINRQRERDDYSPELGVNLTNVIGSFLGQCIVECFGGEWKDTTNGWAIVFNEKNKVYPFNKTAKQFKNGAEDSIYSFFTIIPIIFRKDSVNNFNE